MRLAYLDCFAGVSGELILGALIDAGLSLDVLRSELARLPFTASYTIDAQEIAVGGVSGVQVVVSPTSVSYLSYRRPTVPQPSDAFPASSDPVPYADLVSASDLPPEVKNRTLAALKSLYEAEHA